MPGMTFHVTSRTVGKVHWFDEFLRDHIVTVIAESLNLCDTQLIAWTVMSNHYHLIVRQREDPLGILMQAIGRRVALRINVAHKREGRALERPYRVNACIEPEHLRRAIWYVHENAFAAGLCDSAGSYAWSSHYAYIGQSPRTEGRRMKIPALTPAPQVFASRPESDRDRLIRDYKRYATWCANCRENPDRIEAYRKPKVAAGDINWAAYELGGKAVERRQEMDLRDYANRALREVAPDLDMDLLRFRLRGNRAASIRNTLVQRLLSAGYRASAIARYVGVSETTVSNIARDMAASPEHEVIPPC